MTKGQIQQQPSENVGKTKQIKKDTEQKQDVNQAQKNQPNSEQKKQSTEGKKIEQQFDFQQLDFDDYQPQISKVVNAMQIQTFSSLSQAQKKLMVQTFSLKRIKKGQNFFITTSNGKTTQLTPSQKKIVKTIEMGFTICHIQFPKDQSYWKIAIQFIMGISQHFSIDLGINGLVKKGFQLFNDSKKTTQNQVATFSQQPSLHCVQCLQKCRQQQPKKLKNSAFYQKASFCQTHKKLLQWKFKVIGAFFIGAQTLQQLQPQFIKQFGQVQAKKVYSIFSTFATLAKKALQYNLSQKLQSHQKANRSFAQLMRTIISIDPGVLLLPNCFTYNANNQGKLSRIQLQLISKDYDVYTAKFFMRQNFYLQTSTNKWSNAPRNLNQKSSQGQKVSHFYGGRLPITLLQFLMDGIILYGMNITQQSQASGLNQDESMSFFKF